MARERATARWGPASAGGPRWQPRMGDPIRDRKSSRVTPPRGGYARRSVQTGCLAPWWLLSVLLSIRRASLARLRTAEPPRGDTPGTAGAGRASDPRVTTRGRRRRALPTPTTRSGEVQPSGRHGRSLPVDLAGGCPGCPGCLLVNAASEPGSDRHRCPCSEPPVPDGNPRPMGDPPPAPRLPIRVPSPGGRWSGGLRASLAFLRGQPGGPTERWGLSVAGDRTPAVIRCAKHSDPPKRTEGAPL